LTTLRLAGVTSGYFGKKVIVGISLTVDEPADRVVLYSSHNQMSFNA
jgi:hypothetical protein